MRAAALLHDIGHGPFSHVVEPILGFHHEDFTIDAVLSDETEVGRDCCEAYSPELAENVAAIIRGNFRPMALAQLVSSQLDVDRMDYLLRDSLMTGVKYGVYDLEWIIKSLEIERGRRSALCFRTRNLRRRRLSAGPLLYVPTGLFSPHAAFRRIECFNRCFGEL